MREARAIHLSLLVLSERSSRIYLPGEVSLVRRILKESQILMNTNRNLITLIYSLPTGRGLYRSSSAARTRQPRVANLSEDMCHLKLKATLNPPKPSYDVSVKHLI